MFEVAGVVARVGFLLDEAGAIEFANRYRQTRDLADRPIRAKLEATPNLTGFERYEARLKATQERARLRGAYTAHLGADFNPTAFNAMYRELDKTRTAVAKTVVETDRLNRGVGRMVKDSARATAQMATMGLGFIGLAEGIDKAVASSIEFEKQMELIHTQASAPQSEVRKLRNEVLDLATASAQGPIELSKGLFHLESVGLRGAKAMNALKVASQGAAVGQANLEDTATALGSAWLVNIKGAGNLKQVMALLNATVGAGNVRMNQLVEALGTGILPASKEAGLSIKDVFGAMAVFTDEGYKASSAAAQFSTALHFLYNPTIKASSALQSIGLNSDSLARDMHKKNGLLVALSDLKKHLENKFPNIDLILGLKNMGISASNFAKELNTPGGINRAMYALQDGLDKVGKTTSQRIPILQSMLSQFGLTSSETAKLLESPGGLRHAVQLMSKELGTGTRDIIQQEQILGTILPGGRGRIMLTLLNQLDRYQMKLDQIQKGTNQFNDDVTKTQETASYRLKNAWAQVQVALTQLGDKITPVVVKLATGFGKFIDQMRTGKGDGGEFAQSITEITNAVVDLVKALRPLGDLFNSAVGWLHEHKGLVRDAAAAWISYKLAVGGAAKATAAFASIKNVSLILAGVRAPGGLGAAGAVGGVGRAGAGVAVARDVQMAEGAGLGYATNARALYGVNRELGGGIVRSAAGAAPAFARGAAGAVAGVGSLAVSALGGPVGIAIGAAIAASIAASIHKTNLQKSEAGAIGTLSSLPQLQISDPSKVKEVQNAFAVLRGQVKGSREEIYKANDTLNLFFHKDLNTLGVKGVTTLRDQFDKVNKTLILIQGNLGRFKNVLPRLKASDILDPNLASQALSAINALSRDGASSMTALKRSVEFSTSAINKAFTQGSASWAEAMTRNMHVGIKAVQQGMSDGKISTRSGMKEISRLVASNMQIASSSMDKLSADGKARLAQNFRDAADAVRDQMKRAGKVTQAGMAEVTSYLAQELQVYGFTLKEARNEVQPGTRFDGGPTEGSRGLTGQSQAPQSLSINNRAHGGMASPYGGSSADDHLLVDPHGRPVAALSGTEGIVNAPQMGIIDRALGFAQAVGGMPWGSLRDLWGSGMKHYAGGGLMGMVSAANQVDSAHFPYKWGGGHEKTPAPFEPFDCSGAVSYVLQHGGVGIPTSTSGTLMRMGKAGPGAVTVFANPVHTFMRIGNRYFGTSGQNPGGGAGWFDDPGAGYRSRFTQRHFLPGDAFATSVRAPKVVGGGAVGRAVGQALKLGAGAATRMLQAVANAGLGTGQAGDPGPVVGGNLSGNRALGRRLLLAAGFGQDQWSYLDQLWTRESGWNAAARNRQSGAAGIPQDISGNSHGGARGQIAWGLQYIKNRYGSPAKAWAHEVAQGWYNRGGLLRRISTAGVPKFSGGGKPKPRTVTYHANAQDPLGSSGAHTTLSAGQGFTLKSQQRTITHRIADYDAIMGDHGYVDIARKEYDIAERKYNVSEGDYVDPDTGALNIELLHKKEAQLFNMAVIAHRIRDNLAKARAIAKRVMENYQTIVSRLSASLKYAKKKDRSGIQASIKDAKSGLVEYQNTYSDLGFDLQNEDLDIGDLGREMKTLFGTTAAPPAATDTSSTDTSSTDTSSTDTSGGITADQQAQLDQVDALKAIVARGVFIDTSSLGIDAKSGIIGGVSNPNTVGASTPAPYSPELQTKADAMGVNLSAPAGATATTVDGGGTGGGNTFIINTLTPADPATLMAVASASNAGNTYLGTVSSPRTDLGV